MLNVQPTFGQCIWNTNLDEVKFLEKVHMSIPNIFNIFFEKYIILIKDGARSNVILLDFEVFHSIHTWNLQILK